MQVFSTHIMNSHLYLKRIEFYSMASDTWILFHQAANVTHLGHRCASTALMKLGTGFMPRVGSSGQNLEHYLKTHVYIHVVYNYASFSYIQCVYWFRVTFTSTPFLNFR